MRSLVLEKGGVETVEEAVKVNQRALVDKILARYSTEHTLFREMIQNADDASATKVQIRFRTEPYDAKPPPAAKGKQKRHFYGVSISNNGMPFREEDFARIKSICDGNPDETKIGFFGVGFYSSFSVSEEPCVLSGNRAMSFHWKGDGLFVTNATPPKPSSGQAAELQVLLRMVQDGWTVFDLPCRDDGTARCQPLPEVRSFAEFLLRSLSFTRSITSVETFVDGDKVISVGRQVSGNAQALKLPSGLATMKEAHGKYKLRSVRQESISFGCEVEGESDMVELEKVEAVFAVELDQEYERSLSRITKKKAPRVVKVNLLYSAVGGRIRGLTDALNPSGSRGRVFIGFVTQQTTGDSVHVSAPFIPTMERETIDFADPVLNKWNASLLWAIGLTKRLAYEHRCRIGLSSKQQKALDAPESEVVGSLFKKLTSTFVLSESVQSKGGEAEVKEVESEETRLANQRRVVAAMATFACGDTAPLEKIGNLTSAGFFNAIEGAAPTVWSSEGCVLASDARVKATDPALNELVDQLPLIIPGEDLALVPEAKESVDAEEQAKSGSVGGFLQGLVSSLSKLGGRDEKQQKIPGIVELYTKFVKNLVERAILKQMDVADLYAALEKVELPAQRVVKLLHFMLGRQKKLAEWSRWKKSTMETLAKTEVISVPCGWCGVVLRVKLQPHEQEALMRDYNRAVAVEKEGLLQKLTTPRRPNGTGRMVKCSCSRMVKIDPSLSHQLPARKKRLDETITNTLLLRRARFNGTTLATFNQILSSPVAAAIKAISSEDTHPELFALKDTSILPLAVSGAFKDEELTSGLGCKWVRCISWTAWIEKVFALIGVEYENKPLNQRSLQLLTLVLEATARARCKLATQDRSKLVLFMQRYACIPVQQGRVVAPKTAYLGKFATGGFEGLPVVHSYLPDKAEQLLQSSVAQELLVALGVREHVDAKFLFEEFNKGRLKWNRQEILRYLADMRSQLKSDEVKYLSDMNFLPKADIDIKDGKVSPSVRSFPARELYVPSKVLHEMELGLPFVYTLVEDCARVKSRDDEDADQDNGAVEVFFDVTIPQDVLSLLDALGVNKKPRLSHLLRGAREGNTKCLQYILKEWSTYKAEFARLNGRKLPLLPVLGATDLRCVNECLSNSRAALLRLPVIDPDVITAEQAKRLGVRDNPTEAECLQYLLNAPPGLEEAEAVFAYLAMLLPYWSDRTLRIVQSARFIPIEAGANAAPGVAQRSQVTHVRPCDVFLKTKGEGSQAERFSSLFRFVDFSSEEANRFLQICGVRSEPSPSELAMEIATGDNAAQYVSQHGFEQHLHLLRFLSLEFGSINGRSRTQLKRSRCFVGVKESETDKEKVHVLTTAACCYVADNSVLKRLFNPLCAPSETQLEKMYTAMGAKKLSTAVKTKIVYDNTPAVTLAARELLQLLVNRVPLMIFQRDRADLSPKSRDWLKALAKARDGEAEGIVLEVPVIKRVMVLEEEEKERKTTAFCTGDLKLLVTENYDFYDIAEELVRVFLNKVDMNDSLLWSIILQSSTESLMAKGFPSDRALSDFDSMFPRKHAPKPVVKPSPSPPPPPKPEAVGGSPKDPSLQDESLQKQLELLKAQASAMKPPSAGSIAPKSTPPPAVPPTPNGSGQELGGKVSMQKPNEDSGIKLRVGSSGASGRQVAPAPPQQNQGESASPAMTSSSRKRLSSISKRLGKHAPSLGSSLASLAGKQKQKNPLAGLNPAMQEQLRQMQAQLGQNGAMGQRNGVMQPNGHGQTNGVPGHPGGSSLFTDAAARKKELEQGVGRCRKGDGSQHIHGSALNGKRQPEMDMFMNDLDIQDLSKVPGLVINGLECFVVSGQSAQPYVTHAVDADVFAAMLKSCAEHIFGIESKVCHVYFDTVSPTAAFNIGGALYFNLHTFVAQRWEYTQGYVEVDVKEGGKFNQPVLKAPYQAYLFWYGVFCHELSHNHVQPHNGAFANYQMFFMSEFAPKLYTVVLAETGIRLDKA